MLLKNIFHMYIFYCDQFLIEKVFYFVALHQNLNNMKTDVMHWKGAYHFPPPKESVLIISL